MTKLLEYVPHTISLRSGLHITLRGKTDAKHFWHVFTSDEYLPFLPALASVRRPELTVIDCGAAHGLFSLFIEHHARTDMLPWTPTSYVLVEPSNRRMMRLRRNIGRNLPDDAVQIHQGLIGRSSGHATFYESRRNPWGSSIIRASSPTGVAMQRTFVDLAPVLSSGPCFLRLDIEGAEYEALETYDGCLENVDALLVEWHLDYGDSTASEALLKRNGFSRAVRRIPRHDLRVDLFLRMRQSSTEP